MIPKWQTMTDHDDRLIVIHHLDETDSHDLENRKCFCGPDIETFDDGWTMIVHERMVQ